RGKVFSDWIMSASDETSSEMVLTFSWSISKSLSYGATRPPSVHVRCQLGVGRSDGPAGAIEDAKQKILQSAVCRRENDSDCGNDLGQPGGSRLRGIMRRRLDHHPDELLGAGRPQQYPAGLTQLGLHLGDRRADRRRGGH